MSVTATLLCALLGIVFVIAGVPKILRTPHYRERIRHWRLPLGVLPIIGFTEVAGAGLLLLGAATRDEGPAIAGAGLLVVTMAGALLTHVRVADPPRRAIAAALLGALAMLDGALLVG